mmetsp:Transcript_90703/g.256959  ORF Transcript_90703/g.256959 Transcript_90703/m.256959 type:complete len:156 (+) Transcript_90703:1-468(+)
MSNDDSQHDAAAPRIRTEQHRSDLCEGCKRYGDCSGFFIEPFEVFAIAKLLSREGGSGSDEDPLEWRHGPGGGGTVELAGSRAGPVRLLPHIYEEPARISQEEAARIAGAQRITLEHQNAPASRSSRSRASSSSSQSRTIRSSEDRAMRRHFQGR